MIQAPHREHELIPPQVLGNVGGFPPEFLDERLVLRFSRPGGDVGSVGWRLESRCQAVFVEQHKVAHV